jgi:hypothetical protein
MGCCRTGQKLYSIRWVFLVPSILLFGPTHVFVQDLHDLDFTSALEFATGALEGSADDQFESKYLLRCTQMISDATFVLVGHTPDTTISPSPRQITLLFGRYVLPPHYS